MVQVPVSPAMVTQLQCMETSGGGTHPAFLGKPPNLVRRAGFAQGSPSGPLINRYSRRKRPGGAGRGQQARQGATSPTVTTLADSSSHRAPAPASLGTDC